MKPNKITFDIPNCDTLFVCACCEEEYLLPSDIEGCPICLSEIKEVQ